MSEKLTIIVHEYNGNILALLFNGEGWYDAKLRDYIGDSLHIDIIENDKGALRWGIDVGNWKDLGKKGVKTFDDNKKLIYELKEGHFAKKEEMMKLLGEFNKVDFSKLSNKGILNYFNKILKIDNCICAEGFTFVAIDLANDFLTNKLNSILEKKAKSNKAEYFSILTTPDEDPLTSEESKEILELALHIKQGKLKASAKNKAIHNHWKKWCWITYALSGPELPMEFFVEQINDLISKNNLQEILKHKKQKRDLIKEKIAKAKTDLSLSDEDAYYFDLGRNVVFLKGLRKEVLILSYYLLAMLVKEMSKRYFIPFNDLRFCTIEEIRALLEKEKIPSIKELSQRKDYCVIFRTGVRVEKVLIGEEAKKFFKEHVNQEEIERNLDELHGQVASPGFVQGIVKIVNSAEDISKVTEQDILVSTATQPDLLPAMKKAKGIITEQGGLTCHAAIVSRELGVPCIVGVKFATKILKDNDKVELDASHGIIRVIKG
ncbi:MAG: PEP-utilizing enzyme [Candidatus Diapherotrites archaeon]|nr:PEP-utilizing enzyme [Candidatus Diapherotrites archaeon]